MQGRRISCNSAGAAMTRRPKATGGGHEFGGQHTEIKLSVVAGYLRAYTRALRPHWQNLWYIDAFAGTGSRTVRVSARDGDLVDDPVPEQVEERKGSARIAIEIEPAFDRLVFMEQNRRHCAALHALKDEFRDRDISIVEGDANKLIQGEIAWSGWRKTRAVMFLDPYGMTVEWETLKAIANTKAIDVWYLFSLSGLYRQAARRADAIDDAKRQAISRMLGTDEWEERLYAAPVEQDLLSAIEDPRVRQRTADVKGLEQYVKQRLHDVFPLVLDPLPLPLNRGAQRYSLFFAASNPDPKAMSLAKKFGSHMLAAGRASHV